jgi:hypothetical protein
VEEIQDATAMVLVGLLSPELFGRARHIERLHWPADLAAIFGAADLLVVHVPNASFRVATVCICTADSRMGSGGGNTPEGYA